MAARRVLVLLLAAAAGQSASAATNTPPPGASSCSGCHAASQATSGPVPPLVGRPAPDIEEAMRTFRSGRRPATVMDRIAKGFTDDEIRAIANWYAAKD
jgi:sulfide dehydrogenase cytochrome subunit